MIQYEYNKSVGLRVQIPVPHLKKNWMVLRAEYIYFLKGPEKWKVKIE